MAFGKKNGQSKPSNDDEALFDEPSARKVFDFDLVESPDDGVFADDYGSPPSFYPPSGSEEVIAYDIAPAGLRLIAFVLDVFLILALAAGTVVAAFKAIGVEIGFAEARTAVSGGFLRAYLVFIIFSAGYFILLHAVGGRTIGKMFMGIRVIACDGGLPRLRGSFARFAGYFVSAAFLLLGFLWALFDSKGQAWHDKIAGTYVVKD
ncbi:MAG: RDD family protein [Deltaproteobacteria bacterium]